MKKTLIYIILITGIVLGAASTMLTFLTGKDILPKIKRLYTDFTSRLKKEKRVECENGIE